MIDNPLVSIIIVNWNGKKWLQKCLDSLAAQTYSNFEIILVDNASSDDSVEYLQSNYPSVTIVQTGSNLGFAGGNNRGVDVANGELILLLNNDTWVERDYLEEFIKNFINKPNIACAQSKLVLMNEKNKLDVAGSFWTSSTFLYHYGASKDSQDIKYNKEMTFFSNKGASMLIRRDVIDKIGLFDEDFWCYYEETDFCHRAWISGYECWYLPSAVCYHANGGSSLLFDNSFIQFHNFKNKLLSFLKNFEIKSLLFILPIYIFLNLGLSLFWFLTKKPKHASALYKAFFWNFQNIKSTLRKRSRVQRNRTKSDSDISLKNKLNPKVSYYLGMLTGKLSEYEDFIS